MNHQMSLYIPHVFVNITEERIIQAFQTRQIGKVNHVDFVPKFGKGNKIYHAAYVHFDYWYELKAPRNENMQADLEVGKELKMYYDDPWYWKLYKNETKKFGGNGQRKERLVLEKPLQEKPEEKEKEPKEPEIFEEDFSTTFTQEEIDEIERMILEEQEQEREEEQEEQEQEEEDEFQECFGWVDARYAELLEAKLAFYENQQTLLDCV